MISTESQFVTYFWENNKIITSKAGHKQLFGVCFQKATLVWKKKS